MCSTSRRPRGASPSADASCGSRLRRAARRSRGPKTQHPHSGDEARMRVRVVRGSSGSDRILAADVVHEVLGLGLVGLHEPAGDVALRDQADEFPVFEEREVAAALFADEGERFGNRRVGRQDLGIAGHDLGEGSGGRGESSCHDTIENIALGEDAHELVGVHDQDGADLVVVHHANGVSHSGGARHRMDDRTLVRQKGGYRGIHGITHMGYGRALAMATLGSRVSRDFPAPPRPPHTQPWQRASAGRGSWGFAGRGSVEEAGSACRSCRFSRVASGGGERENCPHMPVPFV